MNETIERLLELEAKQGSNYIEQSIGYKSDLADNYVLDEVEFLVIRLMTSNGARLIQRHLYAREEPNELEKLLCSYFDDALSKLPIEDTVDIVYRADASPIITKDMVESVIDYPAYLTASKYKLSTDCKCTYIIELGGRTKAKSLYKAYEVVPAIPEYQVEFPRNTKFYVEGYRTEDGYTEIKLVEQPDHPLPVEKLSYNVNQFFNLITSIDIQAAVDKGLKNKIRFRATIDGKPINSCCDSDGQVYLSPTFAQSIWNLSFYALLVSDRKILEDGFCDEGVCYQQVYDEITASGCTDERALYIKAVYEAEDKEEMLNLAIAYRHNLYSKADDVYMSSLSITDPFSSRVNGIYQTAVGNILLHELTHYNNEHFERQKTEERRNLEMEADINAFNAILALKNSKYRKTGVLGVMCAHLISFFMNPYLSPTPNYYREDVRLFCLYDMIDEVDKRRSAIAIQNVLAKWLERFHHINFVVDNDNAVAKVQQIREKIIEVFGNADLYKQTNKIM